MSAEPSSWPGRAMEGTAIAAEVRYGVVVAVVGDVDGGVAWKGFCDGD